VSDLPSVPGKNGQAQAALAALGDDTFGAVLMFASFDTATPEGRDRLATITTADRENLWDLRTAEIAVVDMAVLFVRDEDEETGEVKDVRRVYLIDPVGKVFTTSSKVSATRLSMILASCGNPPWNPPKLLRFERKISDKKKEYLSCQFLRTMTTANPAPISSTPNPSSTSDSPAPTTPKPAPKQSSTPSR
jgi:hypothetical protein